MTTRGLPEGRYGSRRSRPRWVAPLLVVAVLVAGLVASVVAYRNLGDPPIGGERLAFALQGDAGVEITFEVTRDDPSRAGVCVVRARSLDGDETGRKEVYVAPGPDRMVVRTVIRTSRPPVTADVYGCSLQVPPYLGQTGMAAEGG